MRIAKNTCSIIITIALCAYTLSARADVFQPAFTVTEVDSQGAGKTAGSFAASAMMGAKGHSNLALFPDWENTLISDCAIQSGSTKWPGNCNPDGMAAALRIRTGKSWVQNKSAATDQASALNRIVGSLQNYHSPAVVPLYGQADHWVTIVQVTATLSGNGGWDIGNVKLFDGGPSNKEDGGSNSYSSGLMSYSGSTFKMFFYKVLENINDTCNPCTMDSWYNTYVVMWEPPPGRDVSDVVTNFSRAPGVSQSRMTEKLSQSLVWRALTSARVNENRDIWNALTGGIVGTAYEVNAVTPAGERWDYFLVPIFAPSQGSNTVKAFVQLAADDGAFEGVHVLPSPTLYHFVSRASAESLASGTLKQGESLTSGILTWDPRTKSSLAKSPSFPYYEFGIMDGFKQIGAVHVSLSTGTVSRMP